MVTTRWVGVDLGEQATVVAEVRPSGDGPRVIRYAIHAAARATAGHRTDDRPPWLHEALAPYAGQDVHLAVSGSEVFMTQMVLPRMPAHERAEAAKWQVKDQLPFPLPDAVVDVYDTLVVAAPKPWLHAAIATIEGAGVRVGSVEPAPLAGWTCVACCRPVLRAGTVALLDCGAQSAQAVIVDAGRVQMTRQLAVGAQQLIDAVAGVVASEAGTVTIDRAMAERLLQQHGVGVPPEATSLIEGIPAGYLTSSTRPVLEHLTSEMARLLDHYHLQLGKGRVTQVVLYGAGAVFPGLPGRLSEGLGVPVEVFNPLETLDAPPSDGAAAPPAQDGPQLVAAIGLALAHGQGVNLLPPELCQQRAAAAVERHVMRWGGALAGALAAVALLLQGASGILQWRYTRRQSVWAELEPAYREHLAAVTVRHTLEQLAPQVQRFLDQQPLWDGVLKELGALTPADIELDRVEVRPAADTAVASWHLRRFHLQGRVVAQEASARSTAVSQFLTALEASPFFAEVAPTGSAPSGAPTGAATFDIEGRFE